MNTSKIKIPKNLKAKKITIKIELVEEKLQK